jgi:hypothetical protein
MRAVMGLCLWAVLFLCWTVQPAFSAQEQEQAGVSAANSLLDEAARQSAGIRSLSADFVQEKNKSMLARPMTSQGYFCLQRRSMPPTAAARGQQQEDSGFASADSLLWAYTRPLASGFVYKNGSGALWEGSPENIRPANERESTVITAIIRNILDWISIDPAALRATYRLERPQADKPVLLLFPLRQSFFARLEVTFAVDLKSVQQLTFVERNGDAVRIVFSRTRINESMPAPCALLENTVQSSGQ